MSLSIRGPWRPLTTAAVAGAPAATGVYELRRDATTVLVGYAGGRSRFGLRGELTALAGDHPDSEYRAEVTTAYLSRWRELLGVHLARTGRLPAGNTDVPGIGPIGPRGPVGP
ncbi:MAG TPA: hypothetical protein VIQ30_19555 [Pseudonocardia sp.]|jgi:hypothetical protein